MRKEMIIRIAILAIAIVWPAMASAFDHAGFDQLLRDHVKSRDAGRSTKVDYAALARSKPELEQYLDSTEKVGRKAFDAWPKAEQLAFLINVYNARTLELVLDGYPGIASIKDLGSLLSSPWSKDFVPLFGKKVSLDDIEHGIIRGSGRYGDPRIHFAVNCASVGCPALRAEAFVAGRLDAQLEDQTRKFLSDRSRNRLKGGKLEISSIFKWYREDFDAGFRGANSLGAFLLLYSDALGLDGNDRKRLSDGTLGLKFLSYDWTLNDI